MNLDDKIGAQRHPAQIDTCGQQCQGETKPPTDSDGPRTALGAEGGYGATADTGGEDHDGDDDTTGLEEGGGGGMAV